MFGKNKNVPFTAPPRYFDSLSERIINKIEAAEELSEFSVLSGINKQTSFEIPAHYFSKIENEIEYKAELEELTELSKIAKPVFKPLDEAYADSLKERITGKIALQDELREFATLYSLEKQQNFEVKVDYFENLSDKIKEKIHASPSNPLAVIQKVLFALLKPKFGIAFGVVLITGIAILFYTNKPTEIIESGDCKTLACLEKREMLNEHTIREMDDDNLYDMVDVDKLDEQIGGGSEVDSTKVNKNNN